MSTVAQIYSIINDVSKQAFGEKAVAVVDSGSFVSLGDKVLSSSTDKELFTNTLVDRIGNTVFSVRQYEGKANGMVRHPFEYGCILQKIYIDLPEAKQNNAWEIGKGDYTPSYAPVIKPTVKQKLFDKIATWELDVTIPDFMLRTAFTNETAMATFIDAIFVAMSNMMEVALEQNANMIRANAIARKLSSVKPCAKINLLTQYNTLTNAGLTVASAMRDTNFLKWASMQIDLWTKRFSNMNSEFNEEGYRRHTPKSEIVLDVLQDFASSVNSFLQSDTYHNEVTALPRYNEVAYWQGAGEAFDFDSVSSINVKLTDQLTVNEKGIVAIAYDYEAMGVTIKERRSTTERNNKDEYTNYYEKANIGSFVDLSEQIIVFYLKEE